MTALLITKDIAYDLAKHSWRATFGEVPGRYPALMVVDNMDIPQGFITEETEVVVGRYRFRVASANYRGTSYYMEGSLDYPISDLVGNITVRSGKKLGDIIKNYGIDCDVSGNDQVDFDYQVPHTTTIKETLNFICGAMRWVWIWNKDKVEIFAGKEKEEGYSIPNTYQVVDHDVGYKSDQEVILSKKEGNESLSQQLVMARIPVTEGLSLWQPVDGVVAGRVIGITTVIANGGDSYQELSLNGS